MTMKDQFGISEIMMDFPANEYISRCEKARNLMERDNIDAMVIAKEENVTYFSGFRRPISYQFVFMILPKRGTPVLVAPVNQRANAVTMSWFDNIRYYGPSGLKLNSSIETAKRVFDELGLADKAIGFEANPESSEQTTIDALKGRAKRLVDVDNLLWELRTIKSPMELKYIRRACRITSNAFVRGLKQACVGMTEKELARCVYMHMLEQGAEDTPLRGALNLRGGIYRYSMFDTRPSDYIFRRGDSLILDGGITYKGYWCDITRIACMGEPSQRQRQLFDACLEAEVAGVDALMPGTKISDVCRIVEKVLRKRGVARNKFHGEQFGHGLGLEIHEPPSIAPDSDIVLQPGMVLAMEPCLYDDPVIRSIVAEYSPGGAGVFFVEDNILVTEKGPENLTPIPRELTIIER